MIYLAVLVLIFFLSYQYDICGRKKGRDIWYYVVMTILILIAGLRWRIGVDTPHYLNVFYRWTPEIQDLNINNLSIGGKPLWVILNSIVYSIGGRFYHVQLIESAFLNILLFNYFKRHTRNIFTCVFFYFIYQYTGMNMEEMKASMSTALFLYANDYLFAKKWTRAYALYIIAILFHAQAILFLAVHFFMMTRLNKKSILIMIVAFFAGYTIQSFIGGFLDMLELMDDENLTARVVGYTESDKYMEQSGGTIRMVNIFVPLVYALYCLYYLKYKVRINIDIIEPLCMIGIICLVMQMNVQIFYRYARCFSVYLIIVYAETFVRIAKSGFRFHMGEARLRSIFVFTPLILCMLAVYIPDIKHVRYYPYSSIFDRKTDRAREWLYSNTNRPSPNIYEY